MITNHLKSHPLLCNLRQMGTNQPLLVLAWGNLHKWTVHYPWIHIPIMQLFIPHQFCLIPPLIHLPHSVSTWFTNDQWFWLWIPSTQHIPIRFCLCHWFMLCPSFTIWFIQWYLHTTPHSLGHFQANLNVNWNPGRQRQFEEKLSQVTTTCGFPLIWVDNPDWIEFCDEFIPAACLPSHNTPSHQIILSVAADFWAHAYADSKGHYGTLQDDGWTGVNNHHFLIPYKLTTFWEIVKQQRILFNTLSGLWESLWQSGRLPLLWLWQMPWVNVITQRRFFNWSILNLLLCASGRSKTHRLNPTNSFDV